ncbi:MAG TPA: D-Ala-D-Ala carboxypeptidase family metallohydrolase [Acidimicrobiales bacterium]
MLLAAPVRWFFFGVIDRTPEPPGPRPGYLSRHVRADQMASKGNGEVKAHPALLARLDALGDRLGAPIPIISGYRDPAHNAAIGGKANSQHLYATAADLDLDYGLTIDVATDLGFSGIGYVVGTDRVAHVDTRAEGPNNTTGASVGAPTTWEYPA